MKIEEIEKLCAEATPGPWEWEYTGSSDYWLTSNGDRIDGLWDRHEFNEQNRELIIALRNNAEKLLAVARAAGICVGDGIIECPEGGPSFYKVENRFAENVRIALEALEQE